MKKCVSCSLCILIVTALLLAGCGGGGGGGGTVSGGGGDGGGGINPTATPTTSSALGSKGYVYKADVAAVSGSRSTSSQFIVLSSNTNPPTGFNPAAGVIVRLKGNQPLIKRTDSQGYFDFGDVSGGTIDSTGSVSVVVDDPAADLPPANYPILDNPLPSSQLTDLRIVPPFDPDTANKNWIMMAGELECFYVIGKSGDTWHPVSDSVQWSVAGSNLGSFISPDGIFLSNSDLATTASGSITAQVSGTTLSISLTVYARVNTASIEGYVKDKNGDPVVNAFVEADNNSPGPIPTESPIPQPTVTISPTTEPTPYPATTSSSSPTSSPGVSPTESPTSVPGGGCCISIGIAITDENGYYRITDIPNGTYTVRVSSMYGGFSQEATVAVNGAAQQDFTLSVAVSNLYGMVSPDKYYYQPGATMNLQIGLLNMGPRAVSLNYTSIEFRLVKMDEPVPIPMAGLRTHIYIKDGETDPGQSPGNSGSGAGSGSGGTTGTSGTVIATATWSSGGTIQVEGYGEASIPASAVALKIPETADTGSYCTVEATLVSSQDITVEPSFIGLGTEPDPYPTPTPYPYPTEEPPYTPMPEPTVTSYPSQ
ncbi:MAG: carboxypeptidase-like regulatory domain-containing protein [Candidatus Xenobiia bacterium LiM19]